MTRRTRILALVAGATLGVAAFAGSYASAASAFTPATPHPPVDLDLEIDPCVFNPDMPQCMADDDDGTIEIPDLDFDPCTWTADPESCLEDPGPGDETTTTTTPDPGTDDSGDPPTDGPDDAVPASPNFTG